MILSATEMEIKPPGLFKYCYMRTEDHIDNLLRYLPEDTTPNVASRLAKDLCDWSIPALIYMVHCDEYLLLRKQGMGRKSYLAMNAALKTYLKINKDKIINRYKNIITCIEQNVQEGEE